MLGILFSSIGKLIGQLSEVYGFKRPSGRGNEKTCFCLR